MITRTHAELIATKLDAKRKRRDGHELAIISHGNVKVGWFAIRTGSQHDQAHDHIPGNLHLTEQDCLNLGICKMTREHWIARLTEKGLIRR